MRTVLIIENDPVEFHDLKKKFTNYGWTVVPDNFGEIGKYFVVDKRDELIALLGTFIREKYKSIKLIVLDINLFGGTDDESGIDHVLPNIRKFDPAAFEEAYMNFPAQVPIIVFSRFDDINTKRRVLGNLNHANYFITKDTSDVTGPEKRINDEELILIAETLSGTFAHVLNIRTEQNESMAKQILHVSNILEIQNKLVTSQLGDFRLLIEGGFGQVKTQLDLILKATLLTLTDDQIEKLLALYREDLENALGDKYDQTMKDVITGNSFSVQFKKAVKDGSFSDLTDLCVNVAIETGITDLIPGGKIVGYGLSALVKLLSK